MYRRAVSIGSGDRHALKAILRAARGCITFMIFRAASKWTNNSSPLAIGSAAVHAMLAMVRATVTSVPRL